MTEPRRCPGLCLADRQNVGARPSPQGAVPRGPRHAFICQLSAVLFGGKGRWQLRSVTFKMDSLGRKESLSSSGLEGSGCVFIICKQFISPWVRYRSQKHGLSCLTHYRSRKGAAGKPFDSARRGGEWLVPVSGRGGCHGQMGNDEA